MKRVAKTSADMMTMNNGARDEDGLQDMMLLLLLLFLRRNDLQAAAGAGQPVVTGANDGDRRAMSLMM